MKRILFLLLTAIISSPMYAQGFGYDSKTKISTGLYKVKSKGFYGIIDEEERVIVSIEYQDIVFRDGKALLTKHDMLLGLVDSVGTVKTYSGIYKVHPQYRYAYEGYIPVALPDKWTGEDKWGYIDENESPLRLRQKISGAKSVGKSMPTLFDDVRPFVDGCAAVFIKKRGWKHIDTNGQERYLFKNKKNNALFRSSKYKGECIIVTNDGIKQYQETDGCLAVVKRILSSTATPVETISGHMSNKLLYKEGILTLDSLNRVTKYETMTDSVIFIEKPRTVIVKKVVTPVDTLSLKDDLKLELVYKNLQANSKGRAYTEVKLINTSNEVFDSLSVTLKCTGAERIWNGQLEGKSEVRISFNIPVKFSTISIKRDLFVEIKNKKEIIEQEFPIIIKRYTPVRSRL